MAYHLLGKTWGIAPERQTLREAEKRISGYALWFKCALLNLHRAVSQ